MDDLKIAKACNSQVSSKEIAMPSLWKSDFVGRRICGINPQRRYPELSSSGDSFCCLNSFFVDLISDSSFPNM